MSPTVPTMTLRHLTASSAALVAALVAPSALAQDAPAEGASAGGEASVTLDSGSAPAEASDGEGNAHDGFLVAGKVGGIVPFSGLGPFVAGGLELGYAFGDGQFAALLDVTYTTPSASGNQADALTGRISGDTYKWELTQKELVFMPEFQYRFTGMGKFLPYVGLGPRIYFLESVTEGSAGGASFLISKERSTKFGVGLPVGLEYALGPGALFGELLFQWGPLDHRVTGDSNTGGATLFLGYRAVL